MKVWAYYARPSNVFLNSQDVEDVSKVYGEDIEILYAVTPDKKMAKEFRSTRNMGIFREVVRDLSSEEWEKLLGENRDSYLEYRKLETRIPEKSESYERKWTEVKVLLTFVEAMDIEDNADMESIVINGFASMMSPIGLLSTSILKKLFILGYWDALDIARKAEYDIDTELCPWTEIDVDCMNLVGDTPHILRVDKLEYFIKNYGHTLSGQ